MLEAVPPSIWVICSVVHGGSKRASCAPAVVCGPGHIAQAHTPNEFIRVEELKKCLGFLGRLADWAEA